MVSRSECRKFLGGDIRGEKRRWFDKERRSESIVQRQKEAIVYRLSIWAIVPFTSVNKQNNTRYIRGTEEETRWHVYGCQCDAPNPANHWAARWLIYNAPKLQSQKLSASRFDSFLFPSLFFPSDYGLRNTENIDPPPIVAIIVGREYFSFLGYHLFLLFSIFSYRM